MPAASSIGDQTSHGTPLSPGPGSTNVWIGGKPAYRCIIDKHLCPASEGSKAHIGGMVQCGSSSVFINGYQAVRKDDKITEVGATNSITSGNNSVIIN